MQRAYILPLSYVIWIAGDLLLSYALVQAYRKRLYREFPVYFGYLAFHVLHATIAFWVVRQFSWKVTYYYGWGGDALDGPISAALIYELFSKSLAPYGGFQKLGKILFFAATSVLTIVGISMVVFDPHSWPQKIDTLAISMDRSYDLGRVTLLFILFAFHRILGLNWRHYIFGIALGLGINASGSLMSETLRLQIGSSWWTNFIYLLPFSYDIGCAIWAYYLTSEESKVSVGALPYSATLTKWNEAVQAILTPFHFRDSHRIPRDLPRAE